MFSYFIYSVLVIYPLWKICERAGFNGAIALIALVPYVGLIVVGAILSFSEWKITNKGEY